MTAISLTPGVLAEAVVDLDAIAHNVRVLREHAGEAQVMAVVKADGYGHGALRVARAAVAAGAAELGVATIDEALALRADGITAPLLAWLHPPGVRDIAVISPPLSQSRSPNPSSAADQSQLPHQPFDLSDRWDTVCPPHSDKRNCRCEAGRTCIFEARDWCDRRDESVSARSAPPGSARPA